MIFGNSDNMMCLKVTARTATFAVFVATMLACVIVSFEYFFCKTLECGGIIYPSLSPGPVPMFFAGFYAIFVFLFCFSFIPWDLTFLGFQPSLAVVFVMSLLFYNMAPIAIRLMPWLISHPLHRRVIALFHALVPAFWNMACRVGMMPSLKFREV